VLLQFTALQRPQIFAAVGTFAVAVHRHFGVTFKAGHLVDGTGVWGMRIAFIIPLMKLISFSRLA
jgi:hypothetical protein